MWTAAFIVSAAGSGLSLGFMSRQADLQNAGEPVSLGVNVGVTIGLSLFWLGVLSFLWSAVSEGRRRGGVKGYLIGLTRAIGLGVLALLAGFLVLLVVVHAT